MWNTEGNYLRGRDNGFFVTKRQAIDKNVLLKNCPPARVSCGLKTRCSNDTHPCLDRDDSSCTLAD